VLVVVQVQLEHHLLQPSDKQKHISKPVEHPQQKPEKNIPIQSTARSQEVVTFIEAGRGWSFNGGELLRPGRRERRKLPKGGNEGNELQAASDLSLASEGRVVVVWWSEGGSGFIGSRPEGGPGRISTTGGSAGVSVGAKEGARKEDSIA
jgi:hypothetical protein